MPEMIYLDNNATTRCDEAVVEAMLPFLREQYANPSSVHHFGQQAANQVAVARERVAAALNAGPRQIVFTSSGTESINTAIRGTLAAKPTRRRVVTSKVEHSATLSLCKQLIREGYDVCYLGVDSNGALDPAELGTAITEDTAIVSLMWANNETGVIFPIASIADLCRERGVALHVDAVQAAGKIPIDVSAVPVSLLSVSGHKFHGPKGVGALYVAPGRRIRALLLGGHQERDLRAGTENVAAIAGLGAAAELIAKNLASWTPRVAALRDHFERSLCDRIDIAEVAGGVGPRVCNTSNICFRGLAAEAILLILSENGICASSGSACSSGSLEPSHVLEAMGIDRCLAHGSIRFSLSHETTRDELDRAIAMIPGLIERIRSIGGLIRN